jgi:CelD/BcsL family acetyltransferase involved in cellulose biosynthesis
MVEERKVGLLSEREDLEARFRNLSSQIGAEKRAGRDASLLIAECADITARLASLREDEELSRPPTGGTVVAKLHADVIQDGKRLADLRSDLEDLIAHSKTRSPFLTWEWLYPWWCHYGIGHRLRVVTARDGGGRLIAFAPLMVRRESRRRGFLRESVLRLIGTGDGPRADLLAFPARTGYERAGLSALWDRILDGSDEWDVARLEHVSPFEDGTVLVHTLLESAGRSVNLQSEPICRFGPLGASFEEFVASVPVATRRWKLRVGDRAFRAEHPTLEYVEVHEHAAVEAQIRELAALSVRRLRRQGRRSSWEDARSIECRLEIARRFQERGWLRLDTARVKGAAVAALMTFAYRGVWYLYQLSLDDEFSRFSPGHHLLAHRIRRSIEEGLTDLNLLGGDHEYKKEYAAGGASQLTVVIQGRRPASLMKAGVDLWLEALGRLRPALAAQRASENWR